MLDFGECDDGTQNILQASIKNHLTYPQIVLFYDEPGWPFFHYIHHILDANKGISGVGLNIFYFAWLSSWILVVAFPLFSMEFFF